MQITVAVPGHVRRCDSEKAGRHAMQCETAPEADGTIGPVRLYIAEPITLATTLLDFGLRRPRDEVLAIATKAGFACSEDGAEAPLTCTRGSDRVAVTFKNGRSAKVQQFGPTDKAEREHFYQRIVFRFGLLRTYDDDPEPPEIWQQHGSPARITAWSWGIVLTDMDAAK